ncbi:uncharacterized protein LOC131143882 [Malania oleifera]|uniref:uncharacterized protein LOC131143882 n=1 Tax=Malania oleifera TaxID=397392 RepID=UPI0025AEBF45|nr:uncharacterized protein LOC131143882 [Malania oleifera]
MAEGTPVRDHVVNMIGFLNELEILGAESDGESEVDIVLQSLLDSFKKFFLNYNMNKLFYSLVELLKELQATEDLIRKPTIAHMTEKYTSSSDDESSNQEVSYMAWDNDEEHCSSSKSDNEYDSGSSNESDDNENMSSYEEL